jgi:hypothetical protein
MLSDVVCMKSSYAAARLAKAFTMSFGWLKSIHMMALITVDHILHFSKLWKMLQWVQLDHNTPDSIGWKLTNDGCYSSNITYNMQFLGHAKSFMASWYGSHGPLKNARFSHGWCYNIELRASPTGALYQALYIWVYSACARERFIGCCKPPRQNGTLDWSFCRCAKMQSKNNFFNTIAYVNRSNKILK